MMINNHNLGRIEGKYVSLREVSVEDAAFIVELRNSDKGRKYLHQTSNKVFDQEEYLRKYLTLDNEWYFIIEDKICNAIGCIGIYKYTGDTAVSGRWIMKNDLDYKLATESKLLVMDYMFDVLGIRVAYSDTRVENKGMQGLFKVWDYDFLYEDSGIRYYKLEKERFNSIRSHICPLLGNDGDGSSCKKESCDKRDEVVNRINFLLEQDLAEIDFTQSETMAEDGLLDSLAITRILSALMMEFDVVIPYEDIKRENFNSPKTMAAMVAKYI